MQQLQDVRQGVLASNVHFVYDDAMGISLNDHQKLIRDTVWHFIA